MGGRWWENHHFVDGNKRIAAALFLWFLQKNRVLYRVDGSKRIADNALVPMTLLIAENRPDEKDVLTGGGEPNQPEKPLSEGDWFARDGVPG